MLILFWIFTELEPMCARKPAINRKAREEEEERLAGKTERLN